MFIKLAVPLQKDSIVDGIGIRTVIWTQGCPHGCVGCHNPHTHDYTKGIKVDIDDIKKTIDNLELQDGITFSGGEPFMQPKECYEIAKYAKDKKISVWSYSGYTFEELLSNSKVNDNIFNFLSNIDVLIDGKFVLGERDYKIKYRGSLNQRIIDVKKSLKANKAVLIRKYDKKEKSQKKEILFI